MVRRPEKGKSRVSAIARRGLEIDLKALAIRYAAPAFYAGYDVPWQVDERRGQLVVRAVRLEEEELGNPANAAILLACGGVVENLRLAMIHEGIDPSVEYLPAGDVDDVVATVRPGEPRHLGLEEEALFRQLGLSERPDTDSADDPCQLSPAQTFLLEHAVRTTGCWLSVLDDVVQRRSLADLRDDALALGTAKRSRSAFPLFGREPAGSLVDLTWTAEGPFGIDRLFGMLGGRVRPPLTGDQTAGAGARERMLNASLVVALGATGAQTGPPAWLRVGGATQRLLLHATNQHLTATFVSEPFRQAMTRDRLESLVRGEGPPAVILHFDTERSLV